MCKWTYKRIVDSVKEYFVSLFPRKSVSQGQTDVSDLILAACESKYLKEIIVPLLELESFHRKSLICSILFELEMKGAPEHVLRSIRMLQDDEIARISLSILQNRRS